MPDPAPTDDTPEAAEDQADALLAKWRAGKSWDAEEAEAAEVLLKRLRRGAEPHASLLEALEANRYADGAPSNPTPS